MKKILFIINRKAGTDREKRLEGAIRQYLPEGQFEVSITWLAYLGHGADLAREAVQNGVHTVVAVGGDGSINEIAQGLVGSNTAMAILPLGSGNGLARALKIPLDINKALQLIVKNKQRPIDVGYANEHLFLSNAGVGFDALIAEQFRHNTKRGLSGYAKLVLRSFSSYDPAEYDIDIDGKTIQTKAFLLTVANGNQFGYEFKLAPKASVFDGQLDLCVMPPVGVLSLVPVSVFSLLGNIDKTRYLQHFTGKDITIRSQQLEYLQVDGDAVPLSEKGMVHIRIQPKAINLIVNE
ncbi:diacylglycerol kinase family lipid kinase [Chitinophaga polysaccharea]|uniref:diacylglycerol/lipid kinase family protein n=1 Tax=Chitinophaga TaxID=79328 RepID=UPI001455BF1E|nr:MULTISPECIES: diacylglycerol kinase family protein [Chitinophaga]NLR61488.1 diacylglycerol kinase family lipid kinase [Chitinophaga polysaccharea]NLU93917.1 diacylglycerol kinase family lipid kinase [Chitinophaga sp. Ak27]